MSPTMTTAEEFVDAIERAARDLPHDWIIQVCVERGAAWVQAVYDQCETWSEKELDVDGNESLSGRIDAAVIAIQEIEANRDQR